MKKDKHFSFRTTKENWDYIVALAKTDDRTPSYLLNKMIEVNRKRGEYTAGAIS